MDKPKPSRTSDIPAIMRALHQSTDDEPKILADPIAPKLVDIAARTQTGLPRCSATHSRGNGGLVS